MATTQTDVILEHLKNYGTITSMEAFDLYGVTRLAAIIYRLRKSYNIVGEDLECTNRYGRRVTFSEYKLKETDNGEDN